MQRDPLLPGLAALFDPEALFSLLPATPEIPRHRSPRIAYLRYKPGTSCLVGYTWEGAGGVPTVIAKSHRLPDWADRRAWYERARQRQAAGQVLLLDAQATLVTTFPRDLVLKSLRRIGAEHSLASLVHEVCPFTVDAADLAIRPLAYKPHRRFTGQLMAHGQSLAVLKWYTAVDYDAAGSRARRITAVPGVNIPTALGQSDRHRVVAYQWLEGRALHAQLRQDAAGQLVAQVGQALAALHRSDQTGLPTLKPQQLVKDLHALAQYLGRLQPRLTRHATETAARVAKTIESLSFQPCTTHGDFYDGQVLVQPGGIGLVDFDRAARGDPASDLGNFLAHLEFQTLQGTLDCSLLERARAALVDGYRAAGADSRVVDRIASWTSFGLLRLAPHPFRHFWPRWPDAIEELLQRVDQLLPDRPPSTRGGSADSTRPGRAQAGAVCPHAVNPDTVADDSAFTFLAGAFDPLAVTDEFSRWLRQLEQWLGPYRIGDIHVVRHKVQRRCLIAYPIEAACGRRLTVLGKVRAKGLDRRSYATQRALYNAGFSEASPDGISVPRLWGTVPPWRMWCQTRVAGQSLADMLIEAPSQATQAVRRAAEALHKLHTTPIPTEREHDVQDELAILARWLTAAGAARPRLQQRMARILDRSHDLAAMLPTPFPCGIHRDFYPDQIVIDRNRTYLVDFDLYCRGDPLLDVGNFVGHLVEAGLRQLECADALASLCRAFVERYAELIGRPIDPSVQIYTTLTLVRHIGISSQMKARRHLVEPLIGLCEDRLGGG